jgi:hypothetical protein
MFNRDLLRFQVSGFRFQVSGFRFRVSGSIRKEKSGNTEDTEKIRRARRRRADTK